MTETIIVNPQTAIEIRYVEEDIRSQLGEVAFETKYLVRYNHDRDCAIVDKYAPTWYKKLASLHEMICCGEHFREFVPDISEASEDESCCLIEQYVISIAGPYRRDYILARAQMFRTLLKYKLCSKEYEPRIKRTLEYLAELL